MSFTFVLLTIWMGVPIDSVPSELGTLNRDLIQAASRGDTEAVFSILKAGAEVNGKNHLTGWTALTAAAYYGYPQTVEALIQTGADVNVRDFNGGTPLMKAVTLGAYEDKSEIIARKAEVVRALLKAGADATARDRYGVPVWQMPMVEELDELVEIFEQAGVKGIKEQKLMQAIDQGDIEAVRKLIQQGADVNVRDDEGQSAWSEAVIWGSLEIVDLLIQSGADVNAQMADGTTALMIAAERGNSDWVNSLIRAGADVHLRDHQGETALRKATRGHYGEIARLLQEAGARE